MQNMYFVRNFNNGTRDPFFLVWHLWMYRFKCTGNWTDKNICMKLWRLLAVVFFASIVRSRVALLKILLQGHSWNKKRLYQYFAVWYLSQLRIQHTTEKHTIWQHLDYIHSEQFRNRTQQLSLTFFLLSHDMIRTYEFSVLKRGRIRFACNSV